MLELRKLNIGKTVAAGQSSPLASHPLFASTLYVFACCERSPSCCKRRYPTAPHRPCWHPIQLLQRINHFNGLNKRRVCSSADFAVAPSLRPPTIRRGLRRDPSRHSPARPPSPQRCPGFWENNTPEAGRG